MQWLDRLLLAVGKSADSNSVTYFTSHYIVELSLMEYASLRYHPALSCHNLNINKAWISLLYSHSSLSLDEISECSCVLLSFVKSVSQLRVNYSASPCHAVFDKYCMQKYLCVAHVLAEHLQPTPFMHPQQVLDDPPSLED